MSKESGLGAGFLLGGYDFTGDVVAVGEIAGGPALTERVTGIDKLAYERIGLQRDGRMKITNWFNPTAGMGHDRLSTLPYTDVQAQYWHRQVLGTSVACLVAKQANYDGNREADGSFTFETGLEGNAFGLEWCTSLTAFKRTDTTATNGTAVDFTDVSTLFGAQAYLQHTALTGTSCTVTIEDSADNVSFAAVTGLAFAAFTAAGDQRLQTGRTATIRRYIRAVTTGTFTSATFAVAIQRNLTATAF